MVQPLWKTVWRLLKKLRIELPYHPAILLLGTYLKKMKTLIQKDVCTPMFIAALFTIAKIWKQHKCPLTDEWIKMCVCVCVCVCVCTHTMEYYSAIKKNEINQLWLLNNMSFSGLFRNSLAMTEFIFQRFGGCKPHILDS